MLYQEFIKYNQAAFIAKVQDICDLLRINPDWLMVVMYAESRINHQAVNANGGATGLIQFMPATARWLGTTTAALRAMSNVQQLDYVYKYFNSLGATGKMKSVYDLYLVTFFPIALGKPDDWTLQSSDLSAYKIAVNNKIIDLNKDNKITVAEFRDYVNIYLKKKT
jgi:hypothetical protein